MSRRTQLVKQIREAKGKKEKFRPPSSWEIDFDYCSGDPEAFARAARELQPSLTDAEIASIFAQGRYDMERQRQQTYAQTRAAEGPSSPREQVPLADLDEDLGY
jgi:hypothetical protein